MKRFKAFLIKEFYHILRDKRTMLLLFGMPLAQVLLFGYVITNEIKDINVSILDYSKDLVSRDLTTKILASDYFQLQDYLDSGNDIEESFKSGKTKLVIVFEKDFAKKIERNQHAKVQILADASDANTANLMVNYTKGIINTYIAEKIGENPNSMQIVPEVRMLFNEQLLGVYMFVPGTMAMILMLISALMTSVSIAREKEMGTMEVLLVSPLHPLQIILGKVAPYFVLSFFNTVFILIIGVLVFGLPINGSVILVLTLSMLFIFLALSLGILISTAAASQQVAMMISLIALMLPTILLSGFIFPIENMPTILQWISSIMPPKYYIIILKNVMIKGTDFTYVWKETLILAAMTLFFIIVSFKKFKIRLE